MTTTVPLREIIKPAILKKCGEGKYPVLSMTMHDGIMLQSERFKKNLASSDTSNYKVVYRNQLVEGFPIDEGVIYVQKVVDEGIMSPAYRVWDIDTDKIEPDFLEFALHSGKAMQYYRAKLRGTTARRRSLPTPTLLAMEILLPSKEIQRQSVMLLKDVQEAIDTLNQMREQIAELVKSRFIELFGDPVTNPKGWKTSLVRDTSELISDGPFGSNLKTSHYVAEGIRVIRLGNIGSGKFLDEDKAYISEEHYATLKKYTCHAGEIVIGTLGEPNLRACLIPDDIAVSVNKSDCVHFIPKTKLLNNIYACAYLNTEGALQLAQESLHGQTRSRIAMSQVAALPIMLPPLDLQNEFAAFVEQVDKSKLVIQELLKKHELLKEALMQKYFA